MCVVLARVCAVIFLGLCGVAWAVPSTGPITLIESPARIVTGTVGQAAQAGSQLLSSLLQGRMYIPPGGTDDGSRLLKDLLKGPGPGGAALEAYATRKAAWAATSAALATAARTVPAIATTVVVADLLNTVRCKVDPSGWLCDAGQSQVSGQWYCVQVSIANATSPPPYCGATQQASADAALAQFNLPVNTLCGDGFSHTVRSAVIIGSNPGGFQLWSTKCPGFGTGLAMINQYSFYYASHLSCPAITVNGVEIIPAVGPDGKCPANLYAPADDAAVGGKMRDYAPQTTKVQAGDILRGMDQAGVPTEVEPPVYGGPASIPGPTTITTKPDGSQVRDRTDYPIAYGPQGYSWGETHTQDDPGHQELPPTKVETPPGQVPQGGGSPSDIQTCGLPGKPKCAIDETGTPGADPLPDVTSTYRDWKNCITSPTTCLPSLPSLNWGFSLPSSCGPIALPAFAPYLSSIDVCPYQPVIHDLMSLVWAAAGLFAAVRMVFREAVGG